MAVPGSINELLLGSAGGAGYSISRSLRFNSSDSAYLSRTPASAGNRKTWTWAGWVKRSAASDVGHVFSAFTSAASRNNIQVFFYPDSDASHSGRLTIGDGDGAYLRTEQAFRDYGSWGHLVITADTTQATANNRIKVYWNGTQITTWNANTLSTAVPQSTDLGLNTTSTHTIGGRIYSGVYSLFLNGYLADIHFIDGQALDPTSFGEFSATTGVWMPKQYTGTYGTNGFQLKFEDNSSNTATTLGKDTSGNGNNWTPTNLSVTAGAGNDSLVDVPTNGSEVDTGVGGEVRGNYATLNPLKNTGNTLSNGNLDVSIASTHWTTSTIAFTTGKWYAEFTVGSTGTIQMFGICSADFFGSELVYPWGTPSAKDVTYYVADGRVYVSAVNTGNTSSASAGDVISFAVDADTRSVAIRKNNTLLTTKTIAASTAGYVFYVSSGGGSCTATLNFGARSFAYTAPSGFKALCTANLPAPVVTKPSTVMDVLLWSGTGGNRSLTGLNMSPDFVWIKQRNQAYSVGHQLYDIVRGAGSLKQLDSSKTTAEGGGNTDVYGYLSSFDSAGFGVTAGTLGSDYVNASGVTYVGWTWDAGSSTVTNTQGSISSQVRANASAGFSIVTYSGNSTAGATVGHGLGVAPAFVIAKSRNNSSEWMCYHQSLGNAQSIILNTTAAAGSSSGWNSTSPTSTVITLGVSGAGNFSGYTHVIYAFAPVDGYSSFGSYTGNGSTDGPFVFCNFRPRWVLIKDATSTLGHNWLLYDTARKTFNVVDTMLCPNLSNSEFTSADWNIDIVSNGFKVRSSYSQVNTNANTYIYAAFAESPFQYARAR